MNAKRAIGIAYIAIVFAIVLGSLLRPEVVTGNASPDPHYFTSTNSHPAQPMAPMEMPEWAEPKSPNGAEPIRIRAWEIIYADGAVLWLDDNGIPWWDTCNVIGTDQPDCERYTI